jgi:predicted nucleic acid-binding protein
MKSDSLMFVDTNVLVNARFAEAVHHLRTRGRLERASLDDEPLRISRQIIREYLATVTRPQTWSVPLTRDQALYDVDRMLTTYEVLEDGPEVTTWLLALLQEIPAGGRQIHDANIIATMLAYGELRLLTFNVADFRR